MKRNNLGGEEVFSFFLAYIFFFVVIGLVVAGSVLLLINDPLAFGICVAIAAVIGAIYYFITHTTWGEKLIRGDYENHSD